MNVFDIIGPIMIGPSSSHTAGDVRLGQIARKILGEDVVQARIELSGSCLLYTSISLVVKRETAQTHS